MITSICQFLMLLSLFRSFMSFLLTGVCITIYKLLYTCCIVKFFNMGYSSMSSYSKKFTRQQFCDRHHEIPDPDAILLYQLITVSCKNLNISVSSHGFWLAMQISVPFSDGVSVWVIGGFKDLTSLEWTNKSLISIKLGNY